MSTGSPQPSASLRFGTLNWRTILFAYATIVIGGSLAYYASDQKNAALRSDLQTTRTSVQSLSQTVQAGNPALTAEVSAVRQESQVLVQRLEGLERSLGNYDGKFQQLEDRSSEVESARAVQRAKVAGLAAQVETAREHLNSLKTLQADWQAKEASLLSGDSGRRVAASPAHLALVVGILERERPSGPQVLEWELALEALAAPIEQSIRDEKSLIVISQDHVQMLTDLGQQLTKAVAEVEQQQLLLTAVLRESATIQPGEATLEVVLNGRREQLEQDRAARLEQALADARTSAEAEQIARLTKAEREVVEAETRRQEAAARERKNQIDAMARKEQEQIAEETRVKTIQQQAVIDGLTAEAAAVEKAIREAQLEREFDKALPEIQTFLSGFTSSSRKYREDGTEGPVPLSYIRSQGALVQSAEGRQQLMFIVTYSDRPVGLLANNQTGLGYAGDAQKLLIKYGELMVKRGLLAP